MQIEEIPISEIIPYERNPRKNDKAVDIVAKSIKEFGFKVPIILDKDNIIIAGHTRLKAAKKLGLETVPIIWAEDLTDEQAKAFRIMDNKTYEYSDWDLDILKIEMEELKNLDVSLDLTGFSQKDIDRILEIDSDNIYTKKVVAPIYTPSEIKPRENELCDDTKTKELINLIDQSNIPETEKTFLKKAAQRFIVFDYSKIADFYAHSNKETQELMEKLALIIIDFDKAIESGFIQLSEDIANKFLEED